MSIRIRTKITDKEWSVFISLRHQIAFRELIFVNKDGTHWQTWVFQYPLVLSFSILVCAGRNWGKTEEGINHDIAYVLVNYPRHEGLVVTLDQIHLRKILDKVFDYFSGGNKFLSQFWKRSTKTPNYLLVLKNGYVLEGVITGAASKEKATNILGSHVDHIWGDEWQLIRDRDFKNLQQARSNPNTRERYFGVPDGTRGVFYQLDTDDEQFKNHRLKIASYYNPVAWSQKEKRRLIKRYGGEESQEYKHQVKGEHGLPTFSTWDLDAIEKNINPNRATKIFDIYKRDLEQIDFKQIIVIPPRPLDAEKVLMGIDVGYVTPTVIIPFALIKKKWRQLCRINLTQLIYDTQAAVIDYIASELQAEGFGIDTTGAEGRAVVQKLNNPESIYKTKGYSKRIIDVIFSSNITTGYERNPETGEIIFDGALPKERKEDVKSFATLFLQQMFEREEFDLMPDERSFIEFSSEVQSKVGNKTVYKTNETDHIISAFRCFGIALFKQKGLPNAIEIAKGSIWLGDWM